jgi:hypothetical protein
MALQGHRSVLNQPYVCEQNMQRSLLSGVITAYVERSR